MFGFKSAVNEFMKSQIEVNANTQRTVDALLETNRILMERLTGDQVARIDRAFQPVEVQLPGNGQLWTGIVQRVQWDNGGTATIGLLSREEFERRHRASSEVLDALKKALEEK